MSSNSFKTQEVGLSFPFSSRACIPGKLFCPKCGSLRVHRSHRSSLAERALPYAKAYRCHECDYRFTLLGRSVIESRQIQRARRELVVFLAALLALALVLTVVVWFGDTQASPTAHLLRLKPQFAGMDPKPKLPDTISDHSA